MPENPVQESEIRLLEKADFEKSDFKPLYKPSSKDIGHAMADMPSMPSYAPQITIPLSEFKELSKENAGNDVMLVVKGVVKTIGEKRLELSLEYATVIHGSHKVGKVMSEFKQKSLKSGSGHKVTSRSQALAIGLSEDRRAHGKKAVFGGR